MGSNKALAYSEALLVTVLWSSSYVLIKVGLLQIPPLLFAAVRYALAFAVVGVAYVASARRRKGGIRGTPTNERLLLIAAGILGYTLAQGLQYVGLFYLSADTTSFLLNFTPIFVLMLEVSFLGEGVSRLQIAGLLMAIAGAFAFFSGRLSGEGEELGVPIVVVSGLAWAAYLIIVRKIQRGGAAESLRMTAWTMGIGAAGLVLLAAIFEGFKPIPASDILVVIWLAAVNTAFAFFLWNHVLNAIRAFELSVIQNGMLPEIAVLAWLFLGEDLSPAMVLGIALVVIGVVIVQLPALRNGERPAVARSS